MTDSEDHSSTRPISVAELLAKNGSIGAPPVGGRRRRRRGNADSVTVAELTGEIPIITDSTAEPDTATNGAAAHVDEVDVVDVVETVAIEESPEESPEESAEPAADVVEDTWHTADTDATDTDSVETAEAPETEEPEVEAVVADYEAHLEQRDADESPVEFAPPPRRPHVPTPAFSGSPGSAETMSPDPMSADPHVDDGPEVDLLSSLEFETEPDEETTASAFDVPPYLRSNSDTLFGGQSVADDLARRGSAPSPEDIDLGEDHRSDGDEFDTEESSGSSLLRGVWVVVQCILAVAFGAGLFIAFDLLWKWNTIVALVLAVLVILGLVAGVRVVRKTEDIASTLIAVAVGALVAFGPLALLQSH